MISRQIPDLTPDEVILDGFKVGYARVSTEEQNLAMQVDALERAGCQLIFQEKLSAAAKVRPELDEAIKVLRPGDILVVWRLDRLARSMKELYHRLDQIHNKEAGFKSLSEHFDFSTATGKLLLGFFGLMAEFERQLTIERTRAGLKLLKERGVQLGGKKIMTDEKKAEIEDLMVNTNMTNVAIAKQCGVSLASIYGAFKGGRKQIIAEYNARQRIKPESN